ncbi:putative endonuclease III [Heterostelium album PN500]|uniref:Endonuclease III homolog n=1 Tax=Heterostelium pallidum (strain ATCC 26659 / Pp 5 / PN500) TaxID=670386 RepID=D3BQ33_HETP5|nr:putative endonuclease III [Heterostelium album PN500]EFA76584.1 putative endonuclease III [Heterostelium album PN500]|eukprot:XP_020428716.1 putative endonuclease III [Heterostelium album PN500]
MVTFESNFAARYFQYLQCIDQNQKQQHWHHQKYRVVIEQVCLRCNILSISNPQHPISTNFQVFVNSKIYPQQQRQQQYQRSTIASHLFNSNSNLSFTTKSFPQNYKDHLNNSNNIKMSKKRSVVKIEYEKDANDNDDDNNTPTLSGFPDHNLKDKQIENSEKLEEEEDVEDDKTTTTTTTTTTSTSSSSSADTKRPLISRKKLRVSTENVVEGRVKKAVDKLEANRKHWKEEWDLIAEMRGSQLAPVDWAGCETFNDNTLEDKVSRFHVLVACLLSSQTKDAVTYAAMNKLKAHGLTVDNIIATSHETIETLLYPVSFYKRKAIYLKKIVNIMKEKYKGDIPEAYNDIMSLPGIGLKMTNLIVQAWGRVEGIAVDVHMHRICNRLGWVNTNTPEETTKALQDWVPRDRWAEINKLLVGFGQTVCAPTRPKCESCKINHLCPTGIQNMKSTPTTTKKEKSIKKEKTIKKEK